MAILPTILARKHQRGILSLSVVWARTCIVMGISADEATFELSGKESSLRNHTLAISGSARVWIRCCYRRLGYPLSPSVSGLHPEDWILFRVHLIIRYGVVHLISLIYVVYSPLRFFVTLTSVMSIFPTSGIPHICSASGYCPSWLPTFR